MAAERLICLFVVEYKTAFRSSIRLLDDFPSNILFDEARIILNEAKFGGLELALTDEIELICVWKKEVMKD